MHILRVQINGLGIPIGKKNSKANASPERFLVFHLSISINYRMQYLEQNRVLHLLFSGYIVHKIYPTKRKINNSRSKQNMFCID